MLCERVVFGSSICAIYMLKGGVIKEHAVTDYDPNSAWYQTYVAPYFKEEKGKYFTVLEKVVKGAFQFVEEEIACPSQVNLSRAQRACRRCACRRHPRG